MATRFDVVLEGGDAEADLRWYEPGARVEGAIEATFDQPVTCRHLYVRLIWHTEGRGDEDVGTIAEQDAYQGSIEAGQTVRSDFRFVLPFQPWSYAGQYVSIVWAIEVSVDVPMGRDIVHRQPFLVRPRPAR